MTPSSRGRADLLRALGYGQPTLTAAMAALLGYYETPPTEPGDQVAPPGGALRTGRTAPSALPEVQYVPAEVPFWRLEAYDVVEREATSPEPPTTRPATPVWPQRPQHAPTLTPLAPERTIRTWLRRVSAIQRASAEIDLEAAIARLSRGELLRDLPHRTRRAWGASLYIIEDRARRLVPYWLDQDRVVEMLRQLYPPQGVSIARLGDGESQPAIRWPAARPGEVGLPAPHTLVLLLGDLGCLATQGEPVQRLWLHWGRLLRDNENPAVALVPGPLTDIPSALRQLWTVVRWDAAAADRTAAPMPSSAETVQQLLTLLAPAVRWEPGLLRTVRCLLPAGRRDAGLEARVWQDAALRSLHSVAATPDREWRQAALERFARHPEALRRLVLEQIRAWRAQVHEAVWFEEVLSLDPAGQDVEAAEVEAARRFMLALRDTLTQGTPGALDPVALAYACRVTQRLPETIAHDPEILHAVHALYALVQPYVDETQVPLWYDPALRSPVSQPVRRVLVSQVADQVQLQVVESAVLADPGVVPRGSPLGTVSTASGEVILMPRQAPEPAHVFWQGGQPPAWAQTWGYDDYGAWVTLHINGVDQRMRWIPPGQFLMGSPPGEEGRDDDEGPQHTVQLTQGFWLFDTPCTQALWQAVMGDNPSCFEGAQRPVEQVSWEDCQRFCE